VTRVDSDPDVGPLGGTLVRDLLRLDGSGNDYSAVLTRAMSNIWVILGGLCLMLACASWLFWQMNRSSDPSDQDISDKTEAERIVQLARKQWRAGNPGAALDQLDALQSVIKDDPLQTEARNSIERLRRSIVKLSKSPDQILFVERALARADELPAERRDEAVRSMKESFHFMSQTRILKLTSKRRGRSLSRTRSKRQDREHSSSLMITHQKTANDRRYSTVLFPLMD